MKRKTKRIEMTRGQTFSFTETVRDPDTNRPIDLTHAVVRLAMRADMKISPTLILTSDVAPGSPDPFTRYEAVGIGVQGGATTGEYTVTIVPVDTEDLVALGHDDPWLYEVWVDLYDDTDTTIESTFPDISMSVLDLYPQVQSPPA